MKKLRIKRALGLIAGVLALIYIVMLFNNMGHELPMQAQDQNTDRSRVVAIFGATGTIGDGLLKAAIDDPDVTKIHVVTRRPSPRIEDGVESGKVEMTVHKDYLDYTAIQAKLANVDTVFWAIGLSAVGLDQETYREIHLDYPVSFVRSWLEVSKHEGMSSSKYSMSFQSPLRIAEPGRVRKSGSWVSSLPP